MTYFVPGIAPKRGAPLAPPPTTNVRQHFHAKRRSDKAWREATFARIFTGFATPKIDDHEAWAITLTRLHARGAGPDFARLVGSLTAVQDGVCDVLFRACREHDEYRRTHGGTCGSLHDEDPRITWGFGKRKAPACGVEIAIEKVGARPATGGAR